MNAVSPQESSMRLGRPEISRLTRALVISLIVHLLTYGGYQLEKKFHVLRRVHLPAWLQPARLFPAIPVQPPKLVQQQPLEFVDVSPSAATAEAPKNARFYSSKNSQAANPEANLETDMPKISGKQTQVLKAEDVQKSKFDKLQPDFAALQRQRDAQEEAKPKSTKPPGDLVLAKPNVTLRQDDGFTEHSRPRTVKEALLRQNRTQLVGEKAKQDGGVGRNHIVPSFDAKATPFGAYDAEMIEAIQSRWYDLLDQISYNSYRSGRVVVSFRLNYDGRITDMRMVESTVGDMLGLLCQKAILDPAPYNKWPQEMRQLAEKDFRDITFTFFYN